MSDLHELETLVASRIPIIVVQSREEPRVVELFRRIAARRGLMLFRWTASEGLRRLDGGEHPPQRIHARPVDALAHIRGLTRPGLFLLLDLHPYLAEPLVVRLLREIAQRDPARAHTLVLVSPSLDLPREIGHHAARYELAMPGPEELRQLVVEEARGWTALNPGRKVTARSADLAALTRHLAGLTLADARRLARNAIHDDGAITEADIEKVTRAKFELLDQGGVLSFELETAGMEDVAGLENLKDWLTKRKGGFLADAATPGLDPPKGILLLGVQGGGKSLAAKAVAGAWGVPLLRLDFGALYNKFFGESERNLREALRTAASMAPAVLWMDEIEKGIATDQDGGPSKRILGTLLTWMAERKEKVFLVATANDIEALPPELLRKGRFDEIFFVDLPDPAVRARIFAIHLEKRGQDPEGFDLDRLAGLAEGFSGAEIEQAVVAALYAAHGTEGGLAMEHLEGELLATRPLSVLMAEKVGHLRAWAAERTVPA
ncbi:MAG: AAA family ATPase [Chromatiaceae bacterium]|nr:AAA family ATPase [Chromatiaceae bacterium]